MFCFDKYSQRVIDFVGDVVPVVGIILGVVIIGSVILASKVL